MCGIFFTYTKQIKGHGDDIDHQYLKRRGPDGFRIINRQINGKPTSCTTRDDSSSSFLTFVATVLSLRGDVVVEQPLEDKQSGSILCWNGEAWKIDGKPVVGNDTMIILDLLLKAISRQTTENSDYAVLKEETSQAVVDVLSMISGPSAFIFYDTRWCRIFYGRDKLGRRSLLHKIGQDESLSLSSISCSTITKDWVEVEAGCIYRVDFVDKADEPQNSADSHEMRTQIVNNDLRKQIYFLV